MTDKKILYVLLGFLYTMPCVGQRSMPFISSYNSRCPQDRAGFTLTVTNIAAAGGSNQTVKVTGSMIVGGEDGGCGQLYTAIPLTFSPPNTESIAVGQVLATAALDATTGKSAGSGYYTLKPGELLQAYIGSPAGAGAGGTFAGTITVQEDPGAVIANGISWTVQDSASPNLMTNHNVVINAGLPF